MGTYGFSKELGIQIAVDTFTAFLEDNDIEITLAVFGSEDVTISGKLVEDVASFVDDGYVATALAEEYRNDNYPREIGKRPESRVGSTVQSFHIPSFLRRENRDEEEDSFDALPLEEEAKEDEALSVMMPEYLKPVSFEKKTESLEDALKEIYTDSFEKHLQQLINKRGLKIQKYMQQRIFQSSIFQNYLRGR